MGVCEKALQVLQTPLGLMLVGGLGPQLPSRRQEMVTRWLGGGLPSRNGAQVTVSSNSWFPQILEDGSHPCSQAQVVKLFWGEGLCSGKSSFMNILINLDELEANHHKNPYALEEGCMRLAPSQDQLEDTTKRWSGWSALRELHGVAPGQRSLLKPPVRDSELSPPQRQPQPVLLPTSSHQLVTPRVLKKKMILTFFFASVLTAFLQKQFFRVSDSGNSAADTGLGMSEQEYVSMLLLLSGSFYF